MVNHEVNQTVPLVEAAVLSDLWLYYFQLDRKCLCSLSIFILSQTGCSQKPSSDPCGTK